MIFRTQFAQKRRHYRPRPRWKNNKRRWSALGKFLFCQNIVPFDWVMNVSLSWVMFSVKKMLLPAKTAVSTKYNLSKSFHGQNFLRNAIFSVLISGVKLLLIHNWFKKCWWIASYVFSRTWNFQVYQRNSMWNFQGLIKNTMEFPRDLTQFCGISRRWISRG